MNEIGDQIVKNRVGVGRLKEFRLVTSDNPSKSQEQEGTS